LTIDKGGLQCAETASPRNEINAGSASLQKRANAGPYSGSSRPVPGDGVLQVVDIRDTAIVGIANFAIELDLAWACRWWCGSAPTPECTSHSEIST
jgi:hypothetical protein